jgi:sterol O-acyltransferase
MLPTVFFLILGFFAFLHSWLNFWSEVTRFPDRAFYSDWWNSSEFGSYYRKWNIVVHDWLYYYIYIDLIRFFRLFKNKKWMAQLITFFISAIIHEFILYYALGFFYPILFILFTGPGNNLLK